MSDDDFQAMIDKVRASVGQPLDLQESVDVVPPWLAPIVGEAFPLSDDDHRAIGEAAARELAAIPDVLTATYDHAARIVNVTTVGHAFTCPIVLTMGPDTSDDAGKEGGGA